MLILPKAKIIVSVLLILSLLLSATSACTSSNKADTYEKAITIARTAIWKDINSGKAGSATIAILDNGKIVYAEGFGMADREKSIPVDHNTVFNIGSVSKVFTATAIMLLVDEGKVNLDDPVTIYLPEFTMADPRYKEVTVRMTLNHTSGLPGTTGLSNFGFEYNTDFFKQTLQNLSRSHLKHDPGAMAPYCNDGFTLAEMIVERVSGRKFIDFLSERVFKPLSMPNSGLSVGERPGEPIALYYQPDTAEKEPPEAISLLGAGGLGSTAEDLCRFADTFSGSGPQILSKSALEEMRKVQPSLFSGKLKNPGLSYGLGWDVTDLQLFKSQGVQVIGKSGGTYNYNSWVLTAPAHRTSVAIIESGRATSAVIIALDVLNAVLVQKNLMENEQNTVSRPPQPQSIPEQYAKFEGYYAPLMRISFDFKENTLNLTAIEQGRETQTSSLFYHDGYFYDKSGGRSYFTSIDGQDYFVSCIFKNMVDIIHAQKLKTLDQPKSLRIDVDGKQWLIRNAKPFDGITEDGMHCIKSSTIEALPGYVEFLGIKEIMSPDFAGMPVSAIRDQTELSLIDMNGKTWAQVSECLYSPADIAGRLKGGSKTVTIDTSGYSEWLKVEEGLILSFEKPVKGRVIIFSPDGAGQYDSAVDNGEVYVPKDSYVELLGNPGDLFKVIGK